MPPLLYGFLKEMCAGLFSCSELFLYVSATVFYTYTQQCDGQTACYTIRGVSQVYTTDWKGLTVKEHDLFLSKLQMREWK